MCFIHPATRNNVPLVALLNISSTTSVSFLATDDQVERREEETTVDILDVIDTVLFLLDESKDLYCCERTSGEKNALERVKYHHHSTTPPNDY